MVQRRRGMMTVAYVLAGLFGFILLGFAGLIGYGWISNRVAAANLGWAVVDAQGQPVSDARFEQARPFSNGVAAVAQEGRWGYVDKDGVWVIEPRFSSAGDFDDHDRASAGEGPDRGVIDRSGAWVLPPDLERIGAFSDGVALAQRVVKVRYTRESAHRNERSVGLVRPDGTWIVEPAPVEAPERWRTGYGPVDGLVSVEVVGSGWGLVDPQGRTVLPPTFQALGRPAEGLVPAQRDDRYGYIDRSGAWVIPPRWLRAEPFSDGAALVEGGDGDRLIGRDGAVLAGPFPRMFPMSEGLAAARSDGRWGFVDREGAWVISPQYADVGPEGFRDGRARVARDQGLRREWAWIDRRGQLVVDRWAADLTPFDHGRALARLPR